MIKEETTTTKIGKDTYTNDVQKKKILKDDTTLTQYCIIGFDDTERYAIIKQGNTINTRNIDTITQEDHVPQELIDAIKNTNKKTTTKKQNTTKKNTTTEDKS